MTQKTYARQPGAGTFIAFGWRWNLVAYRSKPKKLHDGDLLSWPTLPCMSDVSKQAK